MATPRTADPQPKHKLRVPRARRGDLSILVGTRKGTFVLDGDPGRAEWTPRTPAHLGCTVFHVVADPRLRSHMLAAVRHPELGPTVMVSQDSGSTWSACRKPPAFPAAVEGGAIHQRPVNQVFWLSPGHAYQPGAWFAGTSPQGLFRSDDGGQRWRPVSGLHGHPEFDSWTSLGKDETPDGPKLHSICVDPRSPDRLVLALSSGGVVTTDDGGESWSRLDGGLDPVTASDPHSLAMPPSNPDRLWMQSHFGVYRMDREADDAASTWNRTGPRRSDGAFEDAGFPIAVHPQDPDVAWVVPMDGSDDWSRMPINGRPAVMKTTDGGATWIRQDRGLPRTPTYWTVKRQCLATDGYDPLGVYFGTSTGEVWASTNGGDRWKQIASGLPHIYSVEIG